MSTTADPEFEQRYYALKEMGWTDAQLIELRQQHDKTVAEKAAEAARQKGQTVDPNTLILSYKPEDLINLKNLTKGQLDRYYQLAEARGDVNTMTRIERYRRGQDPDADITLIGAGVGPQDSGEVRYSPEGFQMHTQVKQVFNKKTGKFEVGAAQDVVTSQDKYDPITGQFVGVDPSAPVAYVLGSNTNVPTFETGKTKAGVYNTTVLDTPVPGDKMPYIHKDKAQFAPTPAAVPPPPDPVPKKTDGFPWGLVLAGVGIVAIVGLVYYVQK